MITDKLLHKTPKQLNEREMELIIKKELNARECLEIITIRLIGHNFANGRKCLKWKKEIDTIERNLKNETKN